MNRAARFGSMIVLLAAAFGCAGVKQGASTGTAGSGNHTGLGGFGGSGMMVMPCNGMCADFPATPVVVGNAPGNSASIFGGTNAGTSGPCIIEPQKNTLLPNNWLRPRFRWSAPSGQGLYELRLHAANQANDLVVYTTDTTWTLDKPTWLNLAAHTRQMAISVTVRSAPSGGGSVQMGGTSDFTVAPVGADGKLVYWSTSGTTYFNGKPTGTETVLHGFAVGDEGVVEVLRPNQAAMTTYDQGVNSRAVTCIGCHTSTPDGAYIAFNDFYPWGAVLASGTTPVGAAPPSSILGPGGVGAITQPWVGITSFSKSHWSAGDHIMVAGLGTCGLTPCSTGNGQDMDQQPGLAWFNLESATAGTVNNGSFAMSLKGSAWDWIYAPTTGMYAAAPSFSHDGTFVLFTMTDKVKSGRLASSGSTHLYTVPYSKTSAQSASPVPGDGSKTGTNQYYGSLSADDRFIAYNELDSTTANMPHAALDQTDINNNVTLDGMYSQPKTEIFVIPREGGMKVRMAANDPAPNCGQAASPGINNNWVKWSPQVGAWQNTTYYWLIFSSWREGLHYPTGGPIAQLYMTVVTADEFGPVANYPAVYLWNQPATTSNHTPAWDMFQIPDVN